MISFIISGKDRLIKFNLCKMKCTCYNLKITNCQIRMERIPSKAINGKRETNIPTIQWKGRTWVDARPVARKLSLHRRTRYLISNCIQFLFEAPIVQWG